MPIIQQLPLRMLTKKFSYTLVVFKIKTNYNKNIIKRRRKLIVLVAKLTLTWSSLNIKVTSILAFTVYNCIGCIACTVIKNS